MSGTKLAGGILAGGAGRRVGGADKGLLEWRGRSLIANAIERLAPQVDTLMISANRNLAAYAAFGLPVIADDVPMHAGPLAGIAALLAACPAPWLLCVPVDLPQLPSDLGARLTAAVAAHGARIAVAHDGQRRQVLCQLIDRGLAGSAAAALARGDAAVHAWQDGWAAVEVDFSDSPAAFANLNSFQPR